MLRDTSLLGLGSGIREGSEGKNVLDMQKDVLLYTLQKLNVVSIGLAASGIYLSWERGQRKYVQKT